ncbi:MAG: VOC family protein [Alkalibacterium sp.]|uniref:VOC family protein n=1 Tax=Alkalibacterium sp. TaxID=1872447 RepID=UPI003970BB0C
MKVGKGDKAVMAFILNKNLSVHSVDLNVKNLEEMMIYYRETIGLSILEESDNYASFGVEADNQILLNLIKTDAYVSQSKKAGLFHTAFLVPERKDLGNILFALLKKEVPIEGAADHGYSEAVYLTDPEGNGIEIYRDKPKEDWDILENGMIKGITAEIDIDGVLASREDQLVDILPAGTCIGHVHLSVTDLNDSQRFYIDILGMQLKYEFGSQARFIASGEYHHHVGLNTWLGTDIEKRDPYDLGLTRFTLGVKSPKELYELKEYLSTRNVDIDDEAETFVTITDPSGIRVTVTTSE